MNILVINGSPRGAAGNTEVFVRAFLEGAAGLDDTVESIYLKDKHVEHCIGCFTCWFKTPGVCVHKDDMPELLEKVRHADVMVFASPLYVFNFTGMIKDFGDRLIPMVQPFIEMHDGVCTHPSRYPDYKPKAAVLISNAGFPEQSHFDAMKMAFSMTFNGIPNMTNAICCAGGAIIKSPELGERGTWYLDAVRKAGREVAESGVIAPETQKILDTPLVEDTKVYAERANALWRSMGLTPIE